MYPTDTLSHVVYNVCIVQANSLTHADAGGGGGGTSATRPAENAATATQTATSSATTAAAAAAAAAVVASVVLLRKCGCEHRRRFDAGLALLAGSLMHNAWHNGNWSKTVGSDLNSTHRTLSTNRTGTQDVLLGARETCRAYKSRHTQQHERAHNSAPELPQRGHVNAL